MKLPQSMESELAAWNNGAGIDLASWVGCEGRFALAVGYATVFWPEFEKFDGYILRKGFSQKALRGFEEQDGMSRQSVEWTMNHLHLDSIQHIGCKDISKDKLHLLGSVLKEIHEAKLLWQFPECQFVVQLHVPGDQEKLTDYQLSFWQKKHEIQNNEVPESGPL
jgi:hypothetical protein